MNQIASQLLAVFRLEIRKTFFARRGLWIYLLAAAPFVIILGHIYSVSREYKLAGRLAQKTPDVTIGKMRQIRDGMTREQVVTLLGEPPESRIFTRRDREDREKRHTHEWVQYSDGSKRVQINMEDEKVNWHAIRGGACDIGEDGNAFAVIFQFLFLRLSIFFGCVFVFINLFRGEMLDKSLHYYFLAPVRREVVVAGKFLAGLTASTVVFVLSEALQFAAMFGHQDRAALDQYLSQGHGWNHFFSYLGVTSLACLGYGAVFLAAGVLIRNPLIPAATMLVWEAINGILPLAARRFSIIYYLTSLCPVELPIGKNAPPALAMLVTNVEPATPLLAIGGLSLLCAVILVLASLKTRRMEISYGSE